MASRGRVVAVFGVRVTRWIFFVPSALWVLVSIPVLSMRHYTDTYLITLSTHVSRNRLPEPLPSPTNPPPPLCHRKSRTPHPPTNHIIHLTQPTDPIQKPFRPQQPSCMIRLLDEAAQGKQGQVRKRKASRWIWRDQVEEVRAQCSKGGEGERERVQEGEEDAA